MKIISQIESLEIESRKHDLNERLSERREALSKGYHTRATHAWLKQVAWDIKKLETEIQKLEVQQAP